LLTITARAGCDIDLQYGMVVDRNQIRITEASRTLYQINRRHQLIVQGKLILLTQQQTQDLQELASGLHYLVPKLTLIASEGVELAVETVEQVYGGLVGMDHKSHEKLRKALRNVHIGVREKFGRSGDYFFLGPGNLERVDELVDKELEKQIEEVMSTSLGGILSAIASLTADSELTEQRMQLLSEKLEKVGQHIELQVAPKSDSLRQKAHWFCKKLEALDHSEERLRASINELEPYNLIVTN
jgi:hypothetical protein